jgi:hypothetical protein
MSRNPAIFAYPFPASFDAVLHVATDRVYGASPGDVTDLLHSLTGKTLEEKEEENAIGPCKYAFSSSPLSFSLMRSSFRKFLLDSFPEVHRACAYLERHNFPPEPRALRYKFNEDRSIVWLPRAVVSLKLETSEDRKRKRDLKREEAHLSCTWKCPVKKAMQTRRLAYEK